MRPCAPRWYGPVDRIGQKITGTQEVGHATWTHPIAPLPAVLPVGPLPLDAIPDGHPTFVVRPDGRPTLRCQPERRTLSSDVIPDGPQGPSRFVIPDGPQGRAGIQPGAPQEPLDPRLALRTPEDDGNKGGAPSSDVSPDGAQRRAVGQRRRRRTPGFFTLR